MSDAAEDLATQVETVAAGAASVQFDGVSVEQHDLKTLDEVAQRKAASKAVRRPHRGLFMNKLVPPGATGQ